MKRTQIFNNIEILQRANNTLNYITTNGKDLLRLSLLYTVNNTSTGTEILLKSESKF